MTTSNSTEANKALVLDGIKGVFINRDPTVLDRLFGPDYRQHNPQIPNGTAAIKGLLGNLSSDFKYEPGLVLAEDDYVSIHGRYIGWGPKPMVAVDIFRSPTARSSSTGTSCRKRSRPPRAPTATA
jgi:predicted SnoaL-like aldol condensation-catalyzing enzyme